MTPQKLLAWTVVSSVLALSLSAQEVAATKMTDAFAGVASSSSTPQPALADPPLQHKFFDRQQLLALYAHSGMRVLDTVKTCRELSDGGREDWIPTQSCGGVAAWQVGSVGLALAIGWMFHKHENHRLERITPWLGTGASAAGWTKSVFNIR
jgi:hypothetical protein